MPRTLFGIEFNASFSEPNALFWICDRHLRYGRKLGLPRSRPCLHRKTGSAQSSSISGSVNTSRRQFASWGT